MNLGIFSSVIEKMFTDEVSGYHYISGEEADGTTSTKLPETFSYTNEQCRISFGSIENPSDTSTDGVPIKTNPKIFCSLSSSILEGDYVIVTRYNSAGAVIATYQGNVGLPNVLPTHKEILLTVKRGA